MEVEAYLMPIDASSIKKGMYVMINEKTCKIVSITTSKTGKHGGMKVSLVGLDVFTQTKHIFMCAGHVALRAVDVRRNDYPLVAVYEQGDEIVGEYLNDSLEIEQIPADRTLLERSKTTALIVTILTAVEGGLDSYKVVKRPIEYKEDKSNC